MEKAAALEQRLLLLIIRVSITIAIRRESPITVAIAAGVQ
jgi:hypothetical protein